MKEQNERELKTKILNSMNYNEEEEVIGQEVCDAVNTDDTLKKMFIKGASKILTEFAVAEVKAHKTLDLKEGERIMKEALNLLKGLTMHVCVKVIIKREAQNG